MKQTKEHKLRIIPLGGLGAIGNNMTVFEYGEEMLIVDCGIMFPSEDMPGIDFVIPDFSYIVKNKQRVKGIIITHGHEDHIGAVPFLLQEINAPIYATRLTLGLIQSRLEERPPRGNPTFIEINSGKQMRIGVFAVEFMRINHSIIDGVALALETPAGVIIHTGDFKIDFSPVDGRVTDLHRFADYGERGVLLLMSDSTNAERKGYTRSESVLGDKLVEIFSSARGRIIVASFASNIHRIQQVLDAAQKYNRRVVVSGTTMQKNVEIAERLGYLKYRKDLIIDNRAADSMPNKRLVLICTGSQGEPMSALARMAGGTHKHFAIEHGDTVVVTASVIPGNERMVYNVINSLMKKGAEVYYEQDEDIHVSGHASEEELKLMLSLVRPVFFMPIHGEYRHLKAHARIAESLGIKPSNIIVAENGSILELGKKSFETVGNLQLNQIVVDGKEIEDIANGTIKDRRTMSTDGIVVISVIVARGRLARRPEIVSRGFIAARNNKAIEVIRTDVADQVEKLLADGVQEKDVASFVKKNIKNHIFRLTRRNPLVEIQVLKI